LTPSFSLPSESRLLPLIYRRSQAQCSQEQGVQYSRCADPVIVDHVKEAGNVVQDTQATTDPEEGMPGL
jgi:hypothetical protein